MQTVISILLNIISEFETVQDPNQHTFPNLKAKSLKSRQNPQAGNQE